MRVSPFAAPFMALLGQVRLSTAQRFFAALDQAPVEALCTLFLFQAYPDHYACTITRIVAKQGMIGNGKRLMRETVLLTNDNPTVMRTPSHLLCNGTHWTEPRGTTSLICWVRLASPETPDDERLLAQ